MKYFLVAWVVFFMAVGGYAVSHAQGVDANGVPSVCSEVSIAVNDEVIAELEKAGGKLVTIKGAPAVALLHQIEELVGGTAPFTVDRIDVARPGPDADIVNVLYSKDNCIQNFGHLPIAVFEHLLIKASE